MTEKITPNHGRAVAILLTARVVYAYNWYNIGAVLPLVRGGLHATVPQLGIVLGAFLAGVGIFQIPAGFAALRFGARTVSLAALAGMGAAGLLSAFSPSILVLAILRGLEGVGAAFFFSPALSLISSYYPANVRGPVVGWYNGAFSLGGALGLFGGAISGAAFGWSFSLGVGGVGLVLCAVAAQLFLPSATPEQRPRGLTALWSRGSGVLRSRSIWALALGLTGFWAAVYITAQYFVQYAVTSRPGWGYGLAGGLAALVVVVSLPGGPLGGWLAERGSDRRTLLVLFGAVASAAVFAIPFSPLGVMVAVLVVLGVADGIVFAILYLIPSYLGESRGEGVALGVGFINFVQVLLGSGLAVAFAFVAAAAGYLVAWTFTGALALAALPLLLLVTPNRAGERSLIVDGAAAVGDPSSQSH